MHPLGPVNKKAGVQLAMDFQSLCMNKMHRALPTISRFVPKKVFWGFVTAWRLAGVPTRRSPF